MGNNQIIILGIDPGTNITGYGIIEIVNKKINLIDMGVLRLEKYANQPLKLKKIFEGILLLIDQHHPDEIALEAPFLGKNTQSMLKLGRAQGVSMAAALVREIPVFEYAPRKVKQSVTGKGNASKEQVAGLLSKMLQINPDAKFFDATDGLAVAVCHYLQISSPIRSVNSKAVWKSFVKDNPGRVLGSL